MDSAIDRVRTAHTGFHLCGGRAFREDCDTIAALDALEEGLHELLDARPTRGQLFQRLDAATELIRQGMETAHILHFVKSTTWPDLAKPDIDTCENCRPYREWLEGGGQ